MNSKLLSVLVTVCIVCAFIIIGEWFYAVQAQKQAFNSTISAEKKDSHDEMPSIALTRQPEESYADLVTRPLFIKGRRPVDQPRPADAEASIAANIGDWQLNGIYTTKKGLSALFSRSIVTTAKDNYRKLTIGTDLNGWKLMEIHKDRVLLKQGDQQKELLLRKPKLKESAKPSNLSNNSRSPQPSIPQPEMVPQPAEVIPEPEPQTEPDAIPQSEVISPPA